MNRRRGLSWLAQPALLIINNLISGKIEFSDLENTPLIKITTCEEKRGKIKKSFIQFNPIQMKSLINEAFHSFGKHYNTHKTCYCSKCRTLANIHRNV